MLDIAALCLVVTALLTYLNHRFTRLPMAIGVMVIALGLSLVIVLLDAWGVSHALRRYEESFLRSIDFSDVLMQGMLSFLLFAGALHIDLQALKRWSGKTRNCASEPQPANNEGAEPAGQIGRLSIE